MDEKVIPVGKQQCYDLNAVDGKTKYVLAHLFVEKRTLEQCKVFLRQIKVTCYPQIIERYEKEKAKPKNKRKLVTFVSDGFVNYRTAWSNLFGRVSTFVFGVPIACRKYGLQHNNNHIERYNQDIGDQVKTKRHFGSVSGAGEFLNLRRIIKNFINPHQELKGKTPAEAAGIDLQLGRQKLLSLIHFRAKRNLTKR